MKSGQRKVGVLQLPAGLGNDLPQRQLHEFQVRFPAFEFVEGHRRQQSIRRCIDAIVSGLLIERRRQRGRLFGMDFSHGVS